MLAAMKAGPIVRHMRYLELSAVLRQHSKETNIRKGLLVNGL
jgi:hypothetical protein